MSKIPVTPRIKSGSSPTPSLDKTIKTGRLFIFTVSRTCFPEKDIFARV